MNDLMVLFQAVIGWMASNLPAIFYFNHCISSCRTHSSCAPLSLFEFGFVKLRRFVVFSVLLRLRDPLVISPHQSLFMLHVLVARVASALQGMQKKRHRGGILARMANSIQDNTSFVSMSALRLTVPLLLITLWYGVLFLEQTMMTSSIWTSTALAYLVQLQMITASTLTQQIAMIIEVHPCFLDICSDFCGRLQDEMFRSWGDHLCCCYEHCRPFSFCFS